MDLKKVSLHIAKYTYLNILEFAECIETRDPILMI